MIKFFIYSIFLSILFSACRNYEQFQIDFIYDDPNIVYDFCDTIIIDIPSIDSNDFIKTQFDVKSLCESFIALPLETSKESMIGEIDKIVLCDSLIFVGDFYTQKAIFIFNREGKFLRKISRPGKGPGEYRFHIENFWIDKENKILSIIDSDRSQVIYTDFEGKLLSYSKIQLFGSDLYEIKDSVLFFYVNGRKNPGLLEEIGIEESKEYNLYRIVDNKVQNAWFPINSNNTIFKSINNNFCPLDGRLFFKPTYDYRIFELSDNNTIQCRFMLQFPNNNIYKESDWFGSRKEASDVFRSKDHIGIRGFEITDTYLFIHAICNRFGFNVLYNRKTKETHYGLSDYVNSFGMLLDFNEETMVFAKDYRSKSTENISHLFKEGSKYIEAPVPHDNNPVIVIGDLIKPKK